MIFGFKKSKPDPDKSKLQAKLVTAVDAAATENKTPDNKEKEGELAPQQSQGIFSKLKSRLSRTRTNLTTGLSDLVLGKKEIDQEILDDIETLLLVADVGVEATNTIISNLTERVARKQLHDADALFSALRENMANLLKPCNQPLVVPASDSPFIILMVGINGAGKTTTIGKLSKQFQAQGKSVLLAAGDTFRAAAVEQLQEWGKRNGIPVISQHSGADSASVIFDAVQAANARGIDIVIADTAGRLHTQTNLMEELKKVKRVISKHDPVAPHEVMLVVDAGTGQNALAQAEHFNAAVGLTGITLSKLDGTAKGGIIFAIANKLGIPIRFIGVGEGVDDLRVFDANEFIDALLDRSA